MDDHEPDVTISDWVSAPADSHVHSFRIINHAFADDGKPSVIEVVFKEAVSKKGRRTPQTRYAYDFVDHKQAVAIFGMLEVASSPGEVIWSHMIRPGVPYRGPF